MRLVHRTGNLGQWQSRAWEEPAATHAWNLAGTHAAGSGGSFGRCCRGRRGSSPAGRRRSSNARGRKRRAIFAFVPCQRVAGRWDSRAAQHLGKRGWVRSIQNAEAMGGIWVLGRLAMLGMGELRNAFDEAASDGPDCWAMYGTEIGACE